MKTPRYVIAPEGCAEYLTPGKRYEARYFSSSKEIGSFFYYTDDYDSFRSARLRQCSHLNGGDWIIPDDEAEAPSPFLTKSTSPHTAFPA